MKKIPVILILLAMVIGIVGCNIENGPTEINANKGSFEIYLATTESVRQFGYYDYERLAIAETPSLTGEDIRKYYWDSHVIEVNGSFLEKLFSNGSTEYSDYIIDSNGFRSYQKGGSRFLESAQYMAFVVVVDGEKIYSGTFTGSKAMPAEGETIILGDIADDRFQIKFNSDGLDVRNQDAVYEYFDREGKISYEPVQDSSSMIEDLEMQLETSKREYKELEERLNEILENGANGTSDEKELQALVEWQRARLDLYIIETQEGERHKIFCDLLNGLDPSKIESMTIAADYFRQTAGSDFYVNDRMFNVLEEFYDVIIAGIPFNYDMGNINEEFIVKARAAGINVDISNGFIEATLIPSYLRANFELFLSDILNEYLILRDTELSMILDSDHITAADDENLYIEIDQVAQLVYEWKKFSDTYPNSYPYNIKARLKAEEYMGIYIGKVGFAVSPLYDSVSLELFAQAKASYLRFLNEYKDSAYYRLIADLFIILESRGFKLDSDVLNFIENADFKQYGY
ncbi:MAG: hypothetical protein JXN10_02425 [Clostridia bacterium]|nr:hypothetical protein [Clostridia bacterium]MBN2882354.1 hypothetical protein [Clostridia bacterium]